MSDSIPPRRKPRLNNESESIPPMPLTPEALKPVASPEEKPRPVLRLRGQSESAPKNAAEGGPIESPLDREVSPAMRERIEQVARREEEKLSRELTWHYRAQNLRRVREVFIFLCFIAAGDMVNLCVDEALGPLRWILGLIIVVVALGYYILRALVK